jgi:hypothetical protein
MKYILVLLLSLSAVQSFAPHPAFTSRPTTAKELQTVDRVAPLSLFGSKTKEKVIETAETAEIVVEEEEDKNLLQKIKDAGVAGSVSLFLWEGAFWAISIPVAIFGYQRITGTWPDFSDKEDLGKVGAEAFAFANVARLALPLRIGLAVSTIPWCQANIVDTFMKKDE